MAEEQQQAFEKSKQLLSLSQPLIHFDPLLYTHLTCDASAYGIDAVLSHRMPDGLEQPISFENFDIY